MQAHDLKMASPTFDDGSFISYLFTRSRRGSDNPRDFWRLEIGFMVFATDTFLSFRELLHRYKFKYWWIDTLPLGCILGIKSNKIALLDSMIVSHGAKDLKQSKQGKTLQISMAYTLSEKSWRGEAITQYGCCDYMQKMKERYMHDEEKPEFFRSVSASGGLYC